MFEFIEDVKLKIRQARETRAFHKEVRTRYAELEEKRKQEKEHDSLERELQLEEVKAKIRKQQTIAKPKQGEQKKSAFAAFQDYCSDFANQ